MISHHSKRVSRPNRTEIELSSSAVPRYERFPICNHSCRPVCLVHHEDTKVTKSGKLINDRSDVGGRLVVLVISVQSQLRVLRVSVVSIYVTAKSRYIKYVQ